MNARIIRHFRLRDPYIAELAHKFPDIAVTPSESHFTDLIQSVICQQLSDKAGMTIWNRFLLLYPGRPVTPELVKKTAVKKIRSAGTSHSKAEYLHNVADWFLKNPAKASSLSSLTDADIIRELTTIKGIGRWTAEMFLIFSLGREDVFSFGDAGLMRAIRNVYGNDKITSEKIAKITRAWSPYRSYACLLLWKSLG